MIAAQLTGGVLVCIMQTATTAINKYYKTVNEKMIRSLNLEYLGDLENSAFDDKGTGIWVGLTVLFIIEQ